MEDVIKFVPKDTKQIGERDQENKVYIEDYVVTFLKQVSKEDGNKPKEVILLGKYKELNGVSYFYAYGGVCLDNGSGIQLNEIINNYFPKCKILGTVQVNAREKDDLSYDEGKIFMQINFDENFEKILLIQNGLHKRIKGYQIFYSSNEEMQTYMVDWHESRNDKPIEEVGDIAIRQFRLKGNKEELIKPRKQKLNLLPVACSMVAIVMCVIGITMLNDYEQLKTMETSAVHLSKELDTSNLQLQMEEEQKFFEGDEEIDQLEETTNNQEVVSKEVVSDEVAAVVEATEAEEIVASNKETSEVVVDGEAPFVKGAVNEEASEAADVLLDEKESQESVAVMEPSTSQSYTIIKGDTLVSISMRQYQTTSKVKEICEANNIKEPDNISIGQKIILP